MHSTPLSARLGAGLTFFLAAAISIFAQTAPIVTSQPSPQTINAGQAAGFYIYTTGTPSPTFQWQRLPVGSSTWVNLSNAGAYSGTSSYNLTIGLGILAMDGDQFRCVATNTVGSDVSSAVLLTVIPAIAPQIYGVTSAVTVNPGDSLSFSASVSGSQPMTYQWKKDGVAISGATSAYFYKGNVAAADAGIYTLDVSNYAGTVTSSDATVTVNPAVAPAVFNMPASLSVNFGDSLNIYPSIGGTQPMTFQWKKDGVNVSGATSSSYYKSSVTAADNGSYTLTATNSIGTVTSPAATVTVNPAVAPVIVNMPLSLTVGFGTQINLSPSSVFGSQPITYQWKKDGVNIAGANSSGYYKYSDVTTADSGSYTLTATNSAGTVTSPVVPVTVNPAVAPVISSLPATLAVNYGESFNLYPSVSGSPTITYQWKKGGVAISGAISYYYGKSGVTATDAGAYTLTATNPAGAVTSSVVTVTVNPAVAPTISNLSAPVTVGYGTSFSLSASVAGTQPITYQWKKDGVNIAGASSSNYYKYSDVTTADSGGYTLTATNSIGTVTSSSVTVTVNPAVAPTITNMPATITVEYGTSFSINPTINGTQPMTYQWRKGGVIVSNGTSSSYSKYSGVTTADSGIYTLTATNLVGTVTSSSVTLTVNAAVAPAITNLPAPATIAYGASFSINPTVSGTQPMTCQWKKDGVAISGANSSSYSKYSGVTTADSGDYTLTATNSAGTVTSSVMTVTVSPAVAPTVSNLPPSVTVAYGTSFSINPTITGTQPMTYQWEKGGVAVANGNSSSFSKYSDVTTADSGSYTLTVTNVAGSVTSSTVTVTINAAVAPAIYNLPANLSVNYGNSISLNPTITGTQPMTYQWEKDGVSLPNGTASTYSKSGVTPTDSGVYQLKVTNLVGTTTSSSVTVTVNAAVPPAIYNLPAAVTVEYGTTFNLIPSYEGSPTMTYQWKKAGVNIFGAVSGSYSKSNVTTADSGAYTVTATNSVGSATSSSVTVTVNAAVAPAIFNLPTSAQTISYGGYFSFNASVLGTQPITCQWKKDGVALLNATSTYYNVGYATTAHSGVYTLEATNVVGTTISPSITVTVIGAVAPTITQQPLSLSMVQGMRANFNVTAAGTSPITYQWYLAGQPIDGATNSSLVVTNVQAADTGAYTVVATNPGGSITSNAANLTIGPALGVVSVSAGGDHSMFIKSDGTLWAMGYNAGGQLGDGTTTTRLNYVQIATGVVSLSAGSAHAMFIKSDGTLWAMGDNYYGQLGDGTTVTRLNPVQIATGVVSVSAGSSHSMFIKSDGSLWAMGSNYSGWLGDGTTVARLNPVQVATGVAAVSAGGTHTLFIKSNGTLWAMGDNYYGQLGDGTTLARVTPVQITTGVVTILAGSFHSLFIKSDGGLWGMGFNAYGQLGDATITGRMSPVQISTGVVSMAAGYFYSMYIKSDSTLWATGSNTYGQFGDGSTTNRLTPVQVATAVTTAAAGSYHSLFGKSDGSLWAMGRGYNGQLGDGTGASYISPITIVVGPATMPIAPISLLVNDAATASGTRLTWSSVIGTANYEIWRNTTNNTASATLIAGNVPFALYYDLTATNGTTYYYWIKAINSSGASAFSSNTSITVGAPVITSQPATQTLAVESTATFTVVATGTPSPTYQWRKDGVNIDGATNNSYTIASVAMGDAGSYTVVVTNSVGTVTSVAAVLTPFIVAPSDAVISFTVE